MSIQDTEKRFGSVEGSMKRGFDETNTRLSELTASDQSLEKLIKDSTENSKKQWAKTLEDLNNNVVFAKTVELMCRTLSARTYTEFGQLQSLLEGLVKLIQEEKSQQVKESETLRQVLFDLNKRVDVELPDAINASVLKVLEDVKAENAKIWEVCLDYAQKTDTKSQDKLLKKSDRLNNYSYAVGGRDSFKIPKLGFTATPAGKGVNDSDGQAQDGQDVSGVKSSSKPSDKSKQTAGKSSAGQSGQSKQKSKDDGEEEDQDNEEEQDQD